MKIRKGLFTLIIIIFAFCICSVVGYASASDRISGSMGKSVTFYVLTHGKASIKIASYEGQAWVKAYFHSTNLFTREKEEPHHGFYNVESSGIWKDVHWVPSATTGTELLSNDWQYSKDKVLSLDYDREGLFEVTISPINNQTINENYWRIDLLIRWNKYPEWEVTSTNNCEVYLNKPFERGQVKINEYIDGTLYNTYYQRITFSRNLEPREKEGYTCTPNQVYIEYSNATGFCKPYEVSFYYTQKQSPKKGHIPINCYDTNDNYLKTGSGFLDITESGYIDPPIISGYTSITNRIYVQLLNNGECDPQSLTFYYEKNSSNITESSSNNNNTPTAKPTAKPTQRPQPQTQPATSSSVPNIGNRVIGLNEKDNAVTWVQENLKKTGKYYQGDNWKVTGNLGNHTKQEVQRFMKDQGYSGHSGLIDQNVINTLANYLNGNNSTPPQLQQKTNTRSAPNIGNRVIGLNEKDSAVSWVQENLKKTGRYYQGDNWKVTGNLGNHTKQEVQRFMKDQGYSNHSGLIDQNVIDTLYDYLHR